MGKEMSVSEWWDGLDANKREFVLNYSGIVDLWMIEQCLGMTYDEIAREHKQMLKPINKCFFDKEFSDIPLPAFWGMIILIMAGLALAIYTIGVIHGG